MIHTIPTSKVNTYPLIMLWVVGVILSVLIGLALALSIYPIVIFLAVIVAGLVLVIHPTIGLWVVIVGASVVSGLIDLYLPFLKPIVWGLALLSIILATIALIKAFFEPKLKKALVKDYGQLITITIIFIASVVLSSLINWHGVSGFLVGLKGYFQVWGLLIAIFYLIKDVNHAKYLMLFFLLLGILQFPAVIHQFLVLVPKRSANIFAEHGIVAGDIVAGTFGGSMTGGGRSSNLALLCVMCVTIMLAKWRAGLASAKFAIFFSILFLSPMFISEAKIFLVLLPVALFILFKDRILSNPLKAIVSFVVLVTLLVSVFFAYSLLPGAKSQRVKSIDQMIEQNIAYNFGKGGYGNARLNRTTVYPFWLNEQIDHGSLLGATFGYGPSSASGGTALNRDSMAFSRYKGYGIGLTGLSSLLWEVGILGTTLALMLFYLAYRLGARAAKQWQNTPHWPLVKAAQISIPLFAISLLHSNYFVFDISFQTMLIVVIGYLIVMTKFGNQKSQVSN